MENDNSSANTAIITIVAIVAILIIAYFAIQMMSQISTEDGDINIDLPGVTSGETGGGTTGGSPQ